MWFKRNPIIRKELKNEVKEEELSKEVISETLFDNGTFRELPCIEQWILELRGRNAKENTINAFVNYIKFVCTGRLPQTREQVRRKEQIRYIENWGLKHPKMLTIEDCLRYNSEMKENGYKGRNPRLAMRNFLESRGKKGYKKLSGAIDQAGKYAHVYATSQQMKAIFAWLESGNREVHDASYFAFKTACRLGATLEAHAKFIDKERHTIWVFEKATNGKGKRKQRKFIPPDLWKLLKPRMEKGGRLFNITKRELNGLLRACYEEVIPKLADDIPMPFHFFRHQFAQHGLRATGWNYGLIAKLGHWTVGTLYRYYGKMDEETAFKEGEKFLSKM
jgi:integrase